LFKAQVVTHLEIMDCVLMARDWDYLIRILCNCAQDYVRIHRDILTVLAGVERVNSNLALQTVCRRTEVALDLLEKR